MPRLSVGQQILVQVVKEEMLGKGGTRYSRCKFSGTIYGAIALFWKACIFQKKITDESIRAQLQELAPYVKKVVDSLSVRLQLRPVPMKSLVIWTTYGAHGNMC